MSKKMNSALVKTALYMALQGRHPTEVLLHHSDKCSQYTSDVYQRTLIDANIQMSMSRAGKCYDNATAENFFGT